MASASRVAIWMSVPVLVLMMGLVHPEACAQDLAGGEEVPQNPSEPPPGPADAEPTQPAETPAPGTEAPSTFPYEAEVSASRLNVRSGPGQNHTQMFVLEKGDRVQVLGREGEWIRVRPPQGCRVWISADVVEEIDGGERVRVVKGNANLRARAGAEGVDVVGQVQPGVVLSVGAKGEGWYQVEAPGEVSVWLHGRYVSHPSDGNRFAEVQALEERMSAEVSRPAAEQQVEPILESARALRAEIRDPELQARLDRLLSTGQQRRDVLGEIETARADIEARYQEELERIREAYRSRMDQVLQQDRERRRRAFLVRGWVQGWGHTLTRPGTHRLVQGGKVLAHLMSSTIDLNDYYGAYVGVVKGVVTRHPDYEEPVIEVEEIERLVEGQ